MHEKKCQGVKWAGEKMGREKMSDLQRHRQKVNFISLHTLKKGNWLNKAELNKIKNNTPSSLKTGTVLKFYTLEESEIGCLVVF